MRNAMVVRIIWMTLLLCLVQGCASTGGTKPNRDPLEGVNRVTYKFNDTLDRAVIKPVAKGYRFITPYLLDQGITNFFANLNDVSIAANNLLQLKVVDALSDVGRIVLNSTFGIGGLIDIASDAGLRKHDEDFGQTLGYWGLGPGPYLVLPFLGPSTLRDGPSMLADAYLNPLTYVEDNKIRWGLRGLYLLDLRADLLSTEEVVNDVAYDRYIFIRNAYLDRRRYKVYDGAPPQQGEDLLDELDNLDSE